MAITSPDNIRTPNTSDSFNLVSDLATLANDVQDALTLRGNAYVGTSSERGLFIPAGDGVLWQDSNGIGMIWKWEGVEWVPAVHSWSGSSTDRTSFTDAPDGFEWFDTTTNTKHIRIGGSWVNRVLGYVSINSPDQMGITGTATTLTGVSISFTLTAPARVKVTGQLRGNGSASTTVVEHGLRDNGSQVLTWTRGANSGNTAALTSSQAVSGVLNLASGSHTFTVTSRVVAGGGTYNSRPQAGEPIYLLIELVA